MAPLQRLYSIVEASPFIGATPSTLRKWILLRRIAVVRIGRSVRIAEDEIRRLQCDGLQPRREVRP